MCKINEIMSMFLLAGENFVLETHLRQPGFAYIACGLFTKTKMNTTI